MRLVAALLALFVSAPAFAQEFNPREIRADERIVGNADAPVTVIEYASLSCPHCGRFHREIYPDLKKTYVDTGKVRLVFRDFPLDRVALAGATLARCDVSSEEALKRAGTVLDGQETWLRAERPMLALIATLGMTQEAAQACLDKETLVRSIIAEAQAGAVAFQIEGTPAFVINGKPANVYTLDEFKAALDPLLAE